MYGFGRPAMGILLVVVLVLVLDLAAFDYDCEDDDEDDALRVCLRFTTRSASAPPVANHGPLLSLSERIPFRHAVRAQLV